MKQLIIYILLFIGVPSSGDKILSLAGEAYLNGDYSASIAYYKEAMAKYTRQAVQIRYNIGQCYMRMDSTDLALQYFHQVAAVPNGAIASPASNNIGVLLVRKQRNKEALEAFRESLIQNPDNEIARYNYELLKKQMQGNQPPPPQPPKKQPPPPPQSSDDQEEEDDSAGIDNRNLPDDYKEMIRQIIQRQRQSRSTNDLARPVGGDTISLLQARRILENMRRNEIQYLQQLKKSAATPHRNEKRPDW